MANAHVHRWLHAAEDGRPEKLLVVCADCGRIHTTKTSGTWNVAVDEQYPAKAYVATEAV